MEDDLKGGALRDIYGFLEQAPDEYPSLLAVSTMWRRMCEVLSLTRPEEEDGTREGANSEHECDLDKLLSEQKSDSSNSNLSQEQHKPICFPLEAVAGMLISSASQHKQSVPPEVLPTCHHLKLAIGKAAELKGEQHCADSRLFVVNPSTDGTARKILSMTDLHAFLGAKERLVNERKTLAAFANQATTPTTDEVLKALESSNVHCMGRPSCSECNNSESDGKHDNSSHGIHGHCLECVHLFALKPPALPQLLKTGANHTPNNKLGTKATRNHRDPVPQDFTHSDDDEDSRKKNASSSSLVARYGYGSYCLEHNGVTKHYSIHRDKADELLDLVDEEDYDTGMPLQNAGGNATVAQNSRYGPSVNLVGESDEDDREYAASTAADVDQGGPSPVELEAMAHQAHNLFSFTIGPAKAFVEVLYCAECGMFAPVDTFEGGESTPSSDNSGETKKSNDWGGNQNAASADSTASLLFAKNFTLPQLTLKLMLIAHIIQTLNGNETVGDFPESVDSADNQDDKIEGSGGVKYSIHDDQLPDPNDHFLVPMARLRDGTLTILGPDEAKSGRGRTLLDFEGTDHLNADGLPNFLCENITDPEAWRRRLFIYKPSLFHPVRHDVNTGGINNSNRRCSSDGEEGCQSRSGGGSDGSSSDGSDGDVYKSQPMDLYDLLNDVFEDGVVSSVAGAAVQGWLGVVTKTEREDCDENSEARLNKIQTPASTVSPNAPTAEALRTFCESKTVSGGEDGACSLAGTKSEGSRYSTSNSSHADKRPVAARQLTTWFRYRFHTNETFAPPAGHGPKKHQHHHQPTTIAREKLLALVKEQEEDPAVRMADGKDPFMSRTPSVTPSVLSSALQTPFEYDLKPFPNIALSTASKPKSEAASSKHAPLSLVPVGEDDPLTNLNERPKALEDVLNLHDLWTVYGYVIEFESEATLVGRVEWMTQQLEKLYANGGKKLAATKNESIEEEDLLRARLDGQENEDGEELLQYDGNDDDDDGDGTNLFGFEDGTANVKDGPKHGVQKSLPRDSVGKAQHTPFSIPSLLFDLVPGVAYLPPTGTAAHEDDFAAILDRTEYTHGRDVFCPPRSAVKSCLDPPEVPVNPFQKILSEDGRDLMDGTILTRESLGEANANTTQPTALESEPIKCYVLSSHACEGCSCHDDQLERMLMRFAAVQRFHARRKVALAREGNTAHGGLVGIGHADAHSYTHNSHSGSYMAALSESESASRQHHSMLVSTNLPQHVSQSQQEDHMLDVLALQQAFEIEMLEVSPCILWPPLADTKTLCERTKADIIIHPTKQGATVAALKTSDKAKRHVMDNSGIEPCEEVTPLTASILTANSCPLSQEGQNLMWLSRFLTLGRVMFEAMRLSGSNAN